MTRFILLMLSGLSAGFINGLLGTGGGIILILTLSRLLNKHDAKEYFSLSLTVTLCLSVLSAILYYKNGDLILSDTVPYIIPALIGGCVGAFLADRSNPAFMKKLFGLICIAGGLNMAGFF